LKLILKITAGIILAFVLLIAGCSALVSSSMDDSKSSEPTPAEVAAKANARDAEVDEEVASGDEALETDGQKNARQSAESYLDTTAFSRSGLIKQLKFEGYSLPDATYGVDALNANWNAQAALKAQEYLDTQSFSRSGLIEQLRFEGFTQPQAAAGVEVAYR
jgi:hypothetical protein